MNSEQGTAATREVRFLIVDDDKVSVMSMQRTLKKLKIVNPIQVARDGVEALEILNAEVAKHGKLPPYIVTLDLNMPRMNGLEFLAEIRSHPDLNKLIVFVLTTSDTPRDVAKAYENNVAGYVVKDNPSETLPKALDMIGTYSRLVELPY